MGRWSQQRRRGGGSQPPAPTPPLPQITSVVTDGSNFVLVTFDSPLTFHAGPAGDMGSITLNGVTYLSTVLNDATSVFVEFAAVPVPGDVWALNFSPNAWEDEPCQLTTGTTI